MLILGFNCYVFNSAATLVEDGRVVAAAHEERFTRERHTGEFPENAIRYCLEQAGAGVDDLDYVAFHWRPLHRFHRRLAQIAGELPDSLRYYGSHGGRWWNMVTSGRDFARRFPGRGRPRYRFVRFGHHLCHAASAYLTSPFDEAAILTVDGSGEIASTTWSVGRGSTITPLREILYPQSLGYYYVALTHYLGFQPDSDEYKVMALASFGGPAAYETFQRIIRLEPDGGYAIDLSYFNYQKGRRDPWVSDRLIRELGPVRQRGEPLTAHHQDVAWAMQRRLEDVVLHMAGQLHARTGLDRLCFAGGTALNSVLNQRLVEASPFREVFVQPAANDAGTPIGSALYLYNAVLGQPRRYVMRDAALGPAYGAGECRAALEAAGLRYEELGQDGIVSRVAELIAEGKVVGWFQGRMEMGPRALGHRSILADPRRAEMKAIINEKVKHREPFRPFAPSVLAEAAHEFFECDRPSPFMLFVHRIRPEKLGVIPAVAHVDGTARTQTVDREVDPLYWRLIHAFGERTGVPVLLNTSFNVMGEPIVCTPRDAIACFRSTDIDALALGDFLVLKA